MEKNENNDKARFQILALDGGGIKGVFTACVLAAIEEDLRIRITDHFDLIAGTSTGGIIAIGLGLGLRPQEIVDFYVKEASRIFPNKSKLKCALHWFRRKYSSVPLQTALKECFGDKKLGDSTKRLLIPSYNIGDDDVYLFRTSHAEHLLRDYKVPAWKVAMATSAAPTYFSCSREVNNMRLIDGGVWANNPSLCAVVEAYGTLKVPLSDIYMMSVGTLVEVRKRGNELDNGGIISWGMNNNAIDTIMRGQNIGAYNHAKILINPDHIIRVNPEAGENEFTLDGSENTKALIAKASHHSRKEIPQIRSMFASHVALPFTPCHVEASTE